MPPPEPRSSTVSPVVQVGHRGRVAAAERGEQRGVGQLVALAVGVEAGAEELGLLVGDRPRRRAAAARGLAAGRRARRGGGVALRGTVSRSVVARSGQLSHAVSSCRASGRT